MDATSRARVLALAGIEVRATAGDAGGGGGTAHVPAGSPKGGQFTFGHGSGGRKSTNHRPKKAAPPQSVPQAPATPRLVKEGDSGEDVRYAQYAMSLLGFKVAQDGRFGPETAAAVEQMQQRLGVKHPNGHISPALLHKMQDAVRLSPCVGGGQRDVSLEAQWEQRDDGLEDGDFDFDETAEAVLDALDEFERSAGGDWAERAAHDVSKELRIPSGKGGGRWTKSPITSAIAHALEAWAKGDGPDDPFVFDGKPIDREPLRKAAVARGITLKRGASRDDIVAALKADTGAKVREAKAAKSPDVGKPVRFTLTGGSVDPAKVREVEVENKIRAYFRDHKTPGGWASIAGLRDSTPDVDRAELDTALKRLAVTPGAQVIPWDNTKALSQADRAAALRFGGQDNHAFRFEDPSPRPVPKSDSKLRNLDVGVFHEGGKISLWEVSDSGERRRRVAVADDLAGLEKWASDNGETELADWARKERKANPNPGIVSADTEVKDITKRLQSGEIDATEAARLLTEHGRRRQAAEDAAAGRDKPGNVFNPTEHLAPKVPDVPAKATKAAKKAAPKPAAPSGALEKTNAPTPDELTTIGELHQKANLANGWVREDALSPSARTHVDNLVEKGWLQKHTSTEGAMYRIDPRPAGARGGTESGALVGEVLPPLPTADSGRISLDKVNRGAILQGYRTDAGGFENVPEDGTADQSRVMRVIVQRIEHVDDNGNPTKALLASKSRIIGHDAATGRRVESDVVPRGSYWAWHMNPEDNTSPDIEGEALNVTDVPHSGASLPSGTAPKAAKKAAAPSTVDLAHLRTLDRETARDQLDLLKVDELKPLLREQGLPVSGKKRDLVDRLVDSVHGGGTSTSAADILAGLPADLTPAQKRARLRGRGIPKEQIDALVPLASRKTAARSTDFGGDLDDDTYDDEPSPLELEVAEDPTLDEIHAMAGEDKSSAAARARELALLGVTRAAGHDVTPGHDELHHYWLTEGLPKWANSPRPWTTLVALLTRHVGLRKAKIFASRWFIEHFGFAAGSDKNRVAHGEPPRGHRIGPG